MLACVYDLLLIYQVQFFKWSSFIGSRIISTYSIFKGIKYIDIVSVNLMFKNASSWYFFSPPAQHYNGDISELELYFVIVNNEYGEQCEEELLPGGRDMRVTNDNVITFIHLVANHRLNYQVKILLVCYFLAWECFAKYFALISIIDSCTKYTLLARFSTAYTKRLDWYVQWTWNSGNSTVTLTLRCLILMVIFSDITIVYSYLVSLSMLLSCLLQVLISGSLESLDIDDLRSNTNYSAGYHPVCVAFLCSKGHLFVTQMYPSNRIELHDM